MKAQKNTKIMVTCALLVALQVILARFLSINTTFVVVNFSFLAVALSGILFGPLWALAVGAVSDLIGATLFPFGAFFPGFTVTAGLVGLIYGLFLHQKGEGFHGRALWLRVVGASLCASLTRLVLNSVWLYIMYGKGLFGMLPARFTETICMVAAQILLIPVLLSLSRQLPRGGGSPPCGPPPAPPPQPGPGGRVRLRAGPFYRRHHRSSAVRAALLSPSPDVAAGTLPGTKQAIRPRHSSNAATVVTTR